MRNLYFVFLSFILLLSSCSNNNTEQSVNEKVDNNNLMYYSKLIHLEKYKEGYVVDIKNPWLKDTLLGHFYIYPDSLELPENLENKTVIRTPVKSAVTYSSTQWSVFLKLNEISRVKGILESNYTNNKTIKQLVADGKITDVGSEINIDIEKIIHLQPDIILYTPYPNSYENVLSLTNAIAFPFADYLENDPLGRAEWLKIIAVIVGKEDVAEQWFNGIVERYNSLKNKCLDINDRPEVFSDLPFEGQWYVPGGNSYIATLFNDAGANYVWKDNQSSGSVPIDFESVLVKAAHADFWRVMNSTNTPFTYDKLLAENELYKLFDAFNKKQLIVCNIKETEYFEHSQYQPDILLKDFIYHFHPEMIEKDYEPVYYKLLK